MINFKKAVSMVVTFGLVLSGLSGCGKNGTNLAVRNEIASEAVEQNQNG